jgi:hypothetical protein
LLPVVVVVAAAAAISNIAQIGSLQTLAAKNRKTHQEKRGKKKPKARYYCALCNYTTEMMMQKKDKENDDEEEDEDEQEGERGRGAGGAGGAVGRKHGAGVEQQRTHQKPTRGVDGCKAKEA